MLRKASDNLIDLIEQMLHKDAATRITMLEVFDHPWIRKYNRKDFSENSLSSESSEEIVSEHDLDEENQQPMFNI